MADKSARHHVIREIVTARAVASPEELRKQLLRRGWDVTQSTLSRDLRYWASRRETAEVSVPDPDSDVVRFGMTVTLKGEDGKRKVWAIVGEDEADAAKGTISHASPMAVALFGKSVGDVVTVGGREWEVVSIAT